ncbi:MAG TPA: beta-Ala-His dipeptidase [Capsulimonadaceae bacterium]|jgi:dipeptidase D
MPYDNLQPPAVWAHFAALNAIPRVSQNEERARKYVIAQAERAGLTWRGDEAGNVVVSVPAVSGIGPDTPAVCIQAHIDMVPATALGVVHDWAKDPIVARIDGGKVYATGTTLGADNGIGAAMALALMTDETLAHGPLELLFTVEEEIGLRGASALDGSLVSARALINLDSEEIEKLTIGCTGGATLQIGIPTGRSLPRGGHIAYTLAVDGALGGHSGLEIGKPRANAIKLLGDFLARLQADGLAPAIAAIEGGSAANAIPKSASAVIVIDKAHEGRLHAHAASFDTDALGKWRADEPGVTLTLTETDNGSEVLDPSVARKLIALIGELPHGVLQWSEMYDGKPETSANTAQITTTTSSVKVIVSVRSFLAKSLRNVRETIREKADIAGGTTQLVSQYPGWEPKSSSPLLTATVDAYTATYGHAPEIEVVHAGLECGAIISKLPGLDAVSFGPEIQGAHTPDECVTIDTVESTWRMLGTLLEKLAR